MQPAIHAITLGVADLDRALAFYRDGLGLQTEGIVGTEFAGSDTEPAGAVAMFTLAGGLVLSLYPATELAKDAGDSTARTAGAVSLGHFVDRREKVDELLDRAARGGGTALGTHERPWGIYAGYFADPDGHRWEVVHFLAGSPG